ncbi:MAG: hypothetical protein WAQ28_13325 [Bacteroidia bacterium]|jgi:hypothetical protein
MNLNISDFIAISGRYAGSFASIVFSGVITAVVVLILSLLVLFLFRRFVLVKRKHIVLKVIAIAYFVLIPLICGFFAFKWQVVNKFGNNLAENITKDVKPVDLMVKDKLSGIVNGLYLNKSENLEGKIPVSVNDLINILSDTLYVNYLQITKVERPDSQNELVNKAIKLYIRVTKSEGIAFLIKKGVSKVLAKQLRLKEETTKQMMDTKLGKLFDDGILCTIVDCEIKQVFGGMKNSILTMLAVILAIPLIEIAIANWLFRKEVKNAAAQIVVESNSNVIVD